MTKQLTPEVESLWRDLTGLPEGAPYPRLQKMWLQKYCLDYGAEQVTDALFTCAKMGWNSLKSVEGLLTGRLSENIRDGQNKPGAGAALAPVLAPGVKQELARLQSELYALRREEQNELESKEALTELAGKTIDDIQKEYSYLLAFRTSATPATFEDYLTHLDLSSLESRAKACQERLRDLSIRIHQTEKKIKELKNG